MKVFIISLLISLPFFSCAQEVIADDVPLVIDTTYSIPDKSPALHKDLLFILTKKVLEPAFTKCFQPGRAYLSFSISKKGEVTDVAVKQNECLFEADDLEQKPALPLCTPAMKNGEPIEVRYSIPVNIN